MQHKCNCGSEMTESNKELNQSKIICTNSDCENNNSYLVKDLILECILTSVVIVAFLALIMVL